MEKIIETQKSLEYTIAKRMDELERKLKESAPVTSASSSASSGASSSASSKIQEEFTSLKDFTLSMISLLRQQIAELSMATDNIEMRHRRKFLLLSGVPESENEDAKARATEVIKTKLGLTDFSSSLFKACHRLGHPIEGRNRPIIFRLHDQGIKTTIWKKKTLLKGSSIVLSEFLTRRRQFLFMEARNKLGMKNVWTVEGNIMAKLPSGAKIRIARLEELESLLDVPVISHPSSIKSPGVKLTSNTVATGRVKRSVKAK